MNKKLIKICCSEWQNASRDIRELSMCRNIGFCVLVMSKGEVNDNLKKETVHDLDVLRVSTRPLGLKIPKSINRFVSLFVWAHYAKKLRPDIISGHDLSGLLIGWLSNIGRKNKAKLIYDSHEFEIGRNAKRNKYQRWQIKCLEGFLIRRCDFSIMVNDIIADEVQKIHKLKDRPIVVRSTPNYWKVDIAICKEIRNGFIDQLGRDYFLLMYHGAVTKGRGIETFIQVISQNSNVAGVILGNGDSTYLKALDDLAEELKTKDRIVFHEAVPIDGLWKYVGAVDAGMILAPATCKNHLFSLPNKFFENIQAETPVVCPNYPAMKQIVDNYNIGLMCDPNSIQDINGCIETLRNDKDLYNKLKCNIRIAKNDLCWENEKNILKKAYQNMINTSE